LLGSVRLLPPALTLLSQSSLTHSDRVEHCVYELRRRLILVRRDVVMHHGRSCVPDAIPPQNADLTIASVRVAVATTTWAEVTNVEAAVQ